MTYIHAPAGFVPAQAVGYGDVDGIYTAVTDQSRLPVAAQIVPDVTAGPVTGLSLINADLLSNTISGWFDASNYHSGSISIFTTAGISAGVISFEQTNDITNAPAGVALFAVSSSTITGNPVSSLTLAASSIQHFEFPISMRYLRFRISTGVVGGTVGATATLNQLQFTRAVANVQQATATSLNAAVVGTAAEDAASSASPIMVGGTVRTATAPTTLVNGDVARCTMTSGAALVVKQYAVPDVDWSYAAAASGIVNTTTAVTVKAAGAASIRNYITAIQVSADVLGAATEVVIRDGAAGTVLWRMKVQNTGLNPTTFNFPTPLRGTAATLVEVATVTAVSGGVYVNVQGYEAL